MTSVIETHNLTKVYSGVHALNGLTMRVQQGCIVGFLGRNGSGKSTTIRILLDIIRRTSGDASLLGEPIGSVAVRRRIGFLGEDKRLYSYMSVSEIIDFTRPLYPTWRVETEQRLLLEFELPPERRVSALSKGMRTKLGLLLNLSRHAELLILDEPSEGLDPVMAEQMLQCLVRQAGEGTTVFFCSHQISEVERIADHVIAIEKGRVILQGQLDNLRQTYRRITFVFEIPPASDVFRGFGVERVEINGRTVNVLASSNADEIASVGSLMGATSVEVQPLGLRELFLEMVKEK